MVDVIPNESSKNKKKDTIPQMGDVFLIRLCFYIFVQNSLERSKEMEITGIIPLNKDN